MRSRTNRIGLGISASVIAQAIQAGQAIILVPFFIRAWGLDGYGRWVTLSVLVSYLFLLELGGQNYVSNLITIEYARGDFSAFRARLGEALSFFMALCGAVFAAISLGLYIACYVSLPFVGRPLMAWEAWVLGLLSAHTLVLAVPGGLYAAVYRATGKYSRGAMWANAFRAFGIAVGVALLLARSGPAAYAASSLVIGLLLTLFLVWDSRQVEPALQGLRLGWREARAGIALLKGSVPFLLMGVMQTTAPQLLTTFLGVYRTPTEVGVFASHRTLASIPNYIGPLVQGPVLPELSTLWGQGRREELRAMGMTAVRTVVFLTGVAAIGLWVAGPIAFRLWTRRVIEVHPLLLALLLVQGFLSAMWSTCSWGPLASNHHRLIAKLSVGAWVLTIIPGLVWLVPRFGVVGAAASVLVGDVIFKVLGFPLAAASFYESPPSLVLRHAIRGAAYLIPFIVLAAAARLLGGGLLPTFLCLGLMAIVIVPIMLLVAKGGDAPLPRQATIVEGGPTA